MCRCAHCLHTSLTSLKNLSGLGHASPCNKDDLLLSTGSGTSFKSNSKLRTVQKSLESKHEQDFGYKALRMLPHFIFFNREKGWPYNATLNLLHSGYNATLNLVNLASTPYSAQISYMTVGKAHNIVLRCRVNWSTEFHTTATRLLLVPKQAQESNTTLQSLLWLQNRHSLGLENPCALVPHI